MDEQTRVVELSRLLSRAKEAHFRYEEAELGGARDQDWAGWYAVYLLGEGIARILGVAAGRLTRDSLSRLLADSDENHRATAPNRNWEDYYAEYILHSFG